MFKKKPTIKTFSPLRSSDRRKTADRIIADYGLEVPKAADGEEATPGTQSALTAIRKSLLPENALSAKLQTTSGPQLQPVNGTVYVGSHGSGEQRILWVKINEKLYPSVYTLWQNPRLLPLLHTPAFVVGKLKSGADLMTPGLAGPPFPPRARKGALVAIASIEDPSVPVAVGTCIIDVADLSTTQGAKGHAVEMFHWAGDDLWDWSTSGRPGTAAPKELPDWQAGQTEQLEEATADMTIDDDEEESGGVSLDADDATAKAPAKRLDFVEGEDAFAERVDDAGGGEKMSTADIDDAFYEAFLYGVHQRKLDHRLDGPKFGLDFPLSQSFILSHLIIPFLPTFTPEQTSSLVIKKTSWKNARKFLMHLHKRKLLLAKDVKSEAVVQDIDFEDREFREFTPYRLPKKGVAPTATNGTSAASGSSGDDSVGQTLKTETLYKPSRDSLSFMFKDQKATVGSYFTATDVRSCVTRYIEANDLIDQKNKRLVRLDPHIANAVLSTSNAVDKDVLAKGTIPRDALIERVIQHCSPFHVILRNGQTVDKSDTKPKAGAPPKIGIIIETRGGNKTATRVHGIEPYSINAQPLADELRKTCAGSTSVEQFKGGKGLEVMVQGPQKDAIIKALEKRGVNKNWVEVTDKTKKKK